MKNFRYPGLRTFDASEGDRFYGREEDTSQILKKIQLHNTIVLLGKSGLGKSSILTTRIIPILNGEFQYTDIPEDLTKKIAIPVRLHTYTPERHIYPLGILDQILTEWDNAPTFLNDIEPGDPGFWEHCKNILLLNPGKTGIVLVFDQFEELFTYPKEGIEFFAEVIADLLNHRMPAGFRQCLMRQLRNAPDSLSEEQLQVIYDDTDVRIIFAIREDRLSDLNQLAGRIPDIQRYFYNLTPLSRPQATEAIVKPAVLESPQLLSAPFIYTPSALDRILTYLSKDNTQPIETFQLQLICQYIEQELIIKQKKIQIEANDLHNLDSIFKVYYDRILNQIPTPKIRRAVQNLIEERLILDGENRRLSLYEGQIVQQLKVPAETLIYLVNQRLLRAEPDNRGGYLYELSHDVMIAPIAEFRDKRRASEVWKKRALTVASIASLLTIMLSYWVSTSQRTNILLQTINPIIEKTFFSDFKTTILLASDLYRITNKSIDSKHQIGKILLYYQEAKQYLPAIQLMENLELPVAIVGADTTAALDKSIESLLPPDSSLSLHNNLMPKMILLAGGTFTMGGISGDSEAEKDETPHQVILPAFSISETEVTVSQYFLYCLATGNPMPPEPNFGWRGDHPIANLTWYEAQAYCQWLSEKTGATYRLPTEAEWEYAAREGGKKYQVYVWGDNLEQAFGNLADSSYYKIFKRSVVRSGYDDGYTFSSPVKSFDPNSISIYDMEGNVSEWVADQYHSEYYIFSPNISPLSDTCNTQEITMVIRGGSWSTKKNALRISNRSYTIPYNRSISVGFRVITEVKSN